MVVIKGKEKFIDKPKKKTVVKMSEQAKKKLRRPQDTQPIPTVGV